MKNCRVGLVSFLMVLLLLFSSGLAEAQKLTIGVPVDMETLDIHDHQSMVGEAVAVNIYDYLYFRDKGGELQPALATDWELIDDYTWRFYLREGVKFHNGEEFNAQSVKVTLERVAQDSGLTNHTHYSTIEKVEIIDDYTVDIITNVPDPILINRISRTGSGMLPPEYFQEVGMEGFIQNPIGTGPYKFVEWQRDGYVRLEVFEDYWRGTPEISEVEFRVIPEASTRISELLTGGVDIALEIPPFEKPRIDSRDGKRTIDSPTIRVMLLYVRLMEGYPTEDLKIRMAIDLAIDRQLIIDEFLEGAGTPVRSRLLPGAFGFNERLYDVDVYNPTRAKHLLREAGYEDGGPTIEIMGPHDRHAVDREVLEAIGAMLEEVGFDVNLEILSWSAVTSRVADRDHSEVRWANLANTLWDGGLAVDYLRYERSDDVIGFDSPEYSELVLAAAQNMDLEEREKQYQKIAEWIAEERLMIHLFQLDTIYGVDESVIWEPRVDEMIWVYDISLDSED